MSIRADELLLKLEKICRSIARGNYDFLAQLEELTIEGKHPKEITDLAESFSLMLLKLQAHEMKLEKALSQLKEKNTHLKDQVHSLKIDIDTMKKASSVSQVAQSAFFKDLLAKAKSRRKK